MKEQADILFLADGLENQVFITQGKEKLGISLNGYIIVKTIDEWHALAAAAYSREAKPLTLHAAATKDVVRAAFRTLLGSSPPATVYDWLEEIDDAIDALAKESSETPNV